MFPTQATEFYLEIGGVDRTSYLRRGTVSVNMRLNQRWDASFELYDPSGSISAQEGKNVLIKELPLAGGEERTFFGKLDDIEQVRAVDNSLGTELILRCQCVDLMSRLDQRVCSEWSVHKNVTAGYIVNWALSLFCPFEGFSFSPAASPGGFIEDGASVEKFVFNKQTVLEVVEEMCQLSDFVAWIDVNGDFHFEVGGSSYAAPFAISATSANFTRISKRRSKTEGGGSAGSGYWNQSWTRTSWAAWEQRYNVFVGDGVSRQWDLYDPLSSPSSPMAAAVVVDIRINGASVDFGGEEEGRAYTWFYGETQIVQDSGEAILTAADTIEVWFHDMTEGFIFVQDLTEINARGVIEGNTGQHARIFDDSQETNFLAATYKAEAKLDIAKQFPDIVTLQANGFGPSPIYPRPGMLFSASLSYPSISGNFIVLEVTAQETAGAGLRYSCKCVKQGSSRRLANGIDYFRGLIKKPMVTNVSGGAGDGGPKTSPIPYRFLVKDCTPQDSAGDNITVYGALLGQASRIRRITASLRVTISADLEVRFRVVDQTSPQTTRTIGNFVVPSGTPVDTTVEFLTFDEDILYDKSVLIPDVIDGDSSTDEDGICAFVIETVGRGTGDVTAPGLSNIGVYNAGTTYALDDLVSDTGGIYQSLANGNVGNTPASSPSQWQLIVPAGPPGQGVPTGGTANQYLTKINSTNYNTQWSGPLKHGFGAAISPGYPTVYFPGAAFSGTIVRWKIVSPTSAPATVKVWKKSAGTATPTSSDSINTSGVSISGAQAVSSTTLSDFTTTTITVGDLLALHLESGLDEVTFELEYSE